MLVKNIDQLPKLSTVPKFISIDFETHPNKEIEGFSFAYLDENKKLKSYYCPVSHHELDYSEEYEYENLPYEFIIKYLKALVKNRALVMHNAQFDMTVMDLNGIEYRRALVEDTMLLHYSLDTERRHGLKNIMKTEYHRDVVTYEDAKGMGFDAFASYADNDARYTYYLYRKLLIQSKKYPRTYDLYKKYEIPFINVLQDMNYFHNQIRIDRELLDKYNTIINNELSMVDAILTDTLGEGVNFNSTKQLAPVFEKLGYKISYTDSGNPSLSEKVLETMRSSQKGVALDALLYYRTIKKMASTYVFPYFDRLEHGEGKNVWIITGYDFSHIGARTGRLSGHNPNMQNQPRSPLLMRMSFIAELMKRKIIKRDRIFRTDREMKKLLDKIGDYPKVKEVIDLCSVDIRKIYIPFQGNIYIGADFSQIELRMAAHLSGDKHMIEEYCKENADIHQKTADGINAILQSTFTRQDAKPVNFGILYGLFYKTFAKESGMPQQKAKEMFAAWWEYYSGIAEFVKRVHVKARKTGYVETILGRRRNMNILGITDFNNFGRRNYAENSSISHSVSGSSADLIKLAMINIRDKYRGKVIQRFQVHDELLMEVKESEGEKYLKLVKAEMENAMTLKVPIVADASLGHSWRAVH